MGPGAVPTWYAEEDGAGLAVLVWVGYPLLEIILLNFQKQVADKINNKKQPKLAALILNYDSLFIHDFVPFFSEKLGIY